MPCFSSPLSRVASALLAFLHGGKAHVLLSPHINGCAPSAAREKRCRQTDSNKMRLRDTVLTSCTSAPEVVGLVIGGGGVARPDSWRRLQQGGHSVHDVRSIQLRACAILQPKAPAVMARPCQHLHWAELSWAAAKHAALCL